jgi:FkbM family methyltransferase
MLGMSKFGRSKDVRLAKRLARSGRLIDGLLWLGFTRLGQKARLRVRSGEHDIRLRTSTPDLEVTLSCFEGEFEEVVTSMPKLRHPLIVDAGGYIGTAAIVFAEAYPDATVVTLEPSTENFRLLKDNVAPYPNILPINKALAPAEGNLTLKNRGTGPWGFTLVDKPADHEASRIEEVQCTTLDDIMRAQGVDGIGILKLDIEGGEHALFSAGAEWVERTDAICIELHDRIAPGCSELYERAVTGRRNLKLAGEKYLSLVH